MRLKCLTPALVSVLMNDIARRKLDLLARGQVYLLSIFIRIWDDVGEDFAIEAEIGKFLPEAFEQAWEEGSYGTAAALKEKYPEVFDLDSVHHWPEDRRTRFLKRAAAVTEIAAALGQKIALQ